MLHEASGIYVDDENMGIDGDSITKLDSEGCTSESSNDDDNLDVANFMMLLKGVENELCPGCRKFCDTFHLSQTCKCYSCHLK